MPEVITSNNLEVHFIDAYEPHYRSRVRRCMVEYSAVRMMLMGAGTKKLWHELWWPTCVNHETVFQTVVGAGIIIKSAFYGLSYRAHSKDTASIKDRTPYHVNSAEVHVSIANGLVRSSQILADMREFDTHSEIRDGIGWCESFDQPDFRSDQFHITTRGDIDLTERWVRRLIESTSSNEWLTHNVELATGGFQEIFEGEKVISALK